MGATTSEPITIPNTIATSGSVSHALYKRPEMDTTASTAPAITMIATSTGTLASQSPSFRRVVPSFQEAATRW